LAVGFLGRFYEQSEEKEEEEEEEVYSKLTQ